MEVVATFVSGLANAEAIARVGGLLRRLNGLKEVALEENLRLAEAWLANPQEPLRMEAWRRAESAEYEGVDGQLLASVAWTGGSMADPKVSHVPPPSTLPAQAAGNAIQLAIIQFDQDDMQMRDLVSRAFPEVRLPPVSEPEDW